MVSDDNPAPIEARGLMAYYSDPVGWLAAVPANVAVHPVAPGVADPVFIVERELTVEVLNDADRFFRAGAVQGGENDSATRRVSYGLLSMNGAEHSRHRAPLLSALRRRSALPEFYCSTASIFDQVTEHWTSGTVVDVLPALRETSFRSVAELVLGIRDPVATRRAALALDAWIDHQMQPRNRAMGKAGDLAAGVEELSLELEEAVDDAVRALDDVDLTPYTRWLLTAYRTGEIDRRAYVGQLVTVLSAAWETTSSAAGWAILLLTQFPDEAHVLGRLFAGRALPDWEDVAEHAALTAFLAEVLRLCSPAVGVKRVTTRPEWMGGLAVTSGAEVICSQFLRHRDPAAWPDPHRFRPARWRDASPNPADYFPFGLGWRRCVGESMADAQLRGILTRLLARFSVVAEPGGVVGPVVRLATSPGPALVVRLGPAGQRAPVVSVAGSWRRLVQAVP